MYPWLLTVTDNWLQKMCSLVDEQSRTFLEPNKEVEAAQETETIRQNKELQVGPPPYNSLRIYP